jgi:hypothetical protein
VLALQETARRRPRGAAPSSDDVRPRIGRPASLQQMWEDWPLTARNTATTGAAHEAEVNRRSPSIISVMESCSPTISTGGELTVKPFSIGGRYSFSHPSVGDLGAPKRNAAQGLFNPTRGISKSCFFGRGPRQDRAAFLRLGGAIAHAHRGFLQILAFSAPFNRKAVSTRRPSRKRDRCRLATSAIKSGNSSNTREVFPSGNSSTERRCCSSTGTSPSLYEPGRPNNQQRIVL